MADGEMLESGELYDQLIKIWLKEKKPGYVVLPGGQMYRVFQLSDQQIKFQVQGTGIDSLYGSRSTTSFVK
jgi:hypothetical protein